jgi:hypothetical protein
VKEPGVIGDQRRRQQTGKKGVAYGLSLSHECTHVLYLRACLASPAFSFLSHDRGVVNEVMLITFPNRKPKLQGVPIRPEINYLSSYMLDLHTITRLR